MSTVNGKPITNARTARQGDPDFDANKAQSVVTNADGSNSTVLTSDIKN